MRHRKQSSKLGYTTSRYNATISALVRNLIAEKRIKTTLQRARHARRLAERLVTLGKKNTLAARRQAIAELSASKPVSVLFADIAPVFAERKGGYTRIIKAGRRRSDSAELAYLEWVGIEAPVKGKKAGAKEDAAAPEEKKD